MPAHRIAATLSTLALIAATMLPATAQAVDTSLQLILTTRSGEFEQRVARYDCRAEALVEVSYLNAAPNFLAIVPLVDEPVPLVMAAVIAASGVRYTAGQWVWWTSGSDASLYDLTLDEDAEPVLSCTEVSDTP